MYPICKDSTCKAYGQEVVACDKTHCAARHSNGDKILRCPICLTSTVSSFGEICDICKDRGNNMCFECEEFVDTGVIISMHKGSKSFMCHDCLNKSIDRTSTEPLSKCIVCGKPSVHSASNYCVEHSPTCISCGAITGEESNFCPECYDKISKRVCTKCERKIKPFDGINHQGYCEDCSVVFGEDPENLTNGYKSRE